MSIEVAGKDSPRKRQTTWYAIGYLAIAVGLVLTIGSLTEVGDTVSLIFSALFVVPGVSYMFAGVRLILRVSGRQPGLPVRGPLGMSLALTAVSGSILSMIFLFFWAIGRSSWVHEGGDLSDFPNGLMIASIAAAAVTVLAIVLAVVTTRIDEGRSKEVLKR